MSRGIDVALTITRKEHIVDSSKLRELRAVAHRIRCHIIELLDELMTFRKIGSRLQGHPTTECPGIEVGTGSLGQGLSISTGLALGFRMDGKSNRVYCMLGDGETQEGSVWEAMMCAGHYGLDNLCA